MSDELIFTVWKTGQFVLRIWTRPDGIVEDVEIGLKAGSPFRGRCGCGGGTRLNLERALASDAEMLDTLELSNIREKSPLL